MADPINKPILPTTPPPPPPPDARKLFDAYTAVFDDASSNGGVGDGFDDLPLEQQEPWNRFAERLR